MPIVRACRNTLISAVPLSGSIGGDGLVISPYPSVADPVNWPVVAVADIGVSIAFCVGEGEPVLAGRPPYPAQYIDPRIPNIERLNLNVFLGAAAPPADGVHRIYGRTAYSGTIQIAASGAVLILCFSTSRFYPQAFAC